MKEKRLPIVFFVCMGILLAFLYGIVELGGLGMEIWEKVIVSIIIGGIIAFVGFAIWKTPASRKDANIYFDETLLPPDAKNIFVLKENLNSKTTKTSKMAKEIDADAVVYLCEGCLEFFDFSTALKYIYFACAEPKIEKSFYKKLVEDDVRIILCNGNSLKIVDNKGKTLTEVSSLT